MLFLLLCVDKLLYCFNGYVKSVRDNISPNNHPFFKSVKCKLPKPSSCISVTLLCEVTVKVKIPTDLVHISSYNLSSDIFFAVM